MSRPLQRHMGRCHCGSLEIEYHSRTPPEETEVRADQCGFCRRHGARAVSDPAGRAIIRAHRPEHLQRYRFGLKTADFLLCRNCGVYVASVMPDGDALYAILLVNAFEDASRFTRAAIPVDYDAENEADRRERRRSRWTPATLELSVSGTERV